MITADAKHEANRAIYTSPAAMMAHIATFKTTREQMDQVTRLLAIMSPSGDRSGTTFEQRRETCMMLANLSEVLHVALYGPRNTDTIANCPFVL